MDHIPQRFLDALADVYDPCCREKGISVVDMGLLHSVSVRDGHARVELLLTSGWCPFATRVLTDVRERVERLPGVDSADVEIVWHTPWTTERLSGSARAKLRFLPEPVAAGDRDAYVAAHTGAARTGAAPAGAAPAGTAHTGTAHTGTAPAGAHTTTQTTAGGRP